MLHGLPAYLLCCMQAKLSQLGRLEERLDVKLAIAAELPGQFEVLTKQQAAGECVADGLRKDVKVRRQDSLYEPEPSRSSACPARLAPRLRQCMCSLCMPHAACALQQP